MNNVKDLVYHTCIAKHELIWSKTNNQLFGGRINSQVWDGVVDRISIQVFSQVRDQLLN